MNSVCVTLGQSQQEPLKGRGESLLELFEMGRRCLLTRGAKLRRRIGRRKSDAVRDVTRMLERLWAVHVADWVVRANG
jgi:hypothetical protein